MTHLLIGFLIWFAVAWLPQFIKSWIVDIRLWWKRKHDKGQDNWVYKI